MHATDASVSDPASVRRALAARVSGLYLLTPDIAAADFAAWLPRCAAALTAGVALLQYRNKHATASERHAQAGVLQALARRHRALFIVNDDVGLAQALGADGVHLGRDDGDIAAARARLPHALVGASCYDDLARAQRAADAGADLLAFGSVFRSATKPHAVHAPLELLRTARERFPAQRIVAIGGISAANIGTVAAAGAHAAAVIGAVFESGDGSDPARAVRELQQAFTNGLTDHGSRYDQSATV